MPFINLQFARGTGIVGGLIEWFDHGRYAHVDAALDDGTLLGARVGEYDNDGTTIPAGVQIRPASYLNGIERLQVHIPVSQPIHDKFYDFCFAQIGKHYDTTAIVGFVSGRDWQEPDSWFCSELIAAALVESGYWHTLSAPANKIAPDDLLLVLSAFVEIRPHEI